MSTQTAHESDGPVHVDAGVGMFWLIGWLFTIAYAQLPWWKALLGMLLWPYFLGVEAR